MIKSAVKFWKLSGSGNDFVCIDNRDRELDHIIQHQPTLEKFTHAICHRGKGIGADGIIFAEAPELDQADIFARFIESDGSLCELCGNGTGCFTNFVVGSGIVDKDIVKILTPAGIVLGKPLADDYIRVCIPSPEDTERDFVISLPTGDITCNFTKVGIPHVVTFVDDLASVDVDTIGYQLRHHPKFAPRGANVNFVQMVAPGEVAIRTFEFGVEGETLACGTGSSASAIMSALHFGWYKQLSYSGQTPVIVHTKGGQKLRVYFTANRETGRVTDVCLETTVRKIFTGHISDDFINQALRSDSASFQA